jgi:hypothetical protein
VEFAVKRDVVVFPVADADRSDHGVES